MTHFIFQLAPRLILTILFAVLIVPGLAAADDHGPTATVDTTAKPGLTYKGVNIQLGGFLASETVFRGSNLESDIGSSFTKIPFANSAALNTAEFRGTERQSRFSLLAQGDVSGNTHLTGYYEADFLAAPPTANPNESNSFSPRTRNVYATVDWDDPGFHILAGQNWSLATLNSSGITPRKEVTPTTIDAQYAVGFDWARQWQLRFTKDWDKTYWLALSFENSQTVGVSGVLNSGTGNTFQLPAGSNFATTTMSINGMPDAILKAAVETSFGHYEVYDLARNFQSKFGGTTTATQTTNQNIWTNAVGAGVIIPVIPKTLDLAGSGLFGSGIGRYGTSGLADATYAVDGSLAPLTGTDWLGQILWHAGSGWEIYGAYGQEQVNNLAGGGGTFGYGTGVVASNAGCSVLGGVCSPEVQTMSQINVGAWWSFYQGDFGAAKLGVQYSHTMLATFADASGLAPSTTEDMVFTSLRYYPF